jgi:hypothetical protein
MRKLAEDLDSPAPALTFLASFFSMRAGPGRVDRIFHGCGNGTPKLPWMR